jgi:beta-xylosidase
MKQILLLLLLFVAGFSNAQKLKYNKDVYPVIESGNYNLAIPLVETFLKQEPDNTNAHYWAAKMYESKLASSDSIPLIQLALNHWIEAKKTVTVNAKSTKISRYRWR